MIEFIKYIVKCIIYIADPTAVGDDFFDIHLSIGGILFLTSLLVEYAIKRYRARYFYDEDIYSESPTGLIISVAVFFLYLVIAYIFWYPKIN